MTNVQTIVLLLGLGLALVAIVFIGGIRGLFLRKSDTSERPRRRRNPFGIRESTSANRDKLTAHDLRGSSSRKEAASIRKSWLVRVGKSRRTKTIVTAGGGRVVVTPPLEDIGDEDVLRVLEDAALQVRTHLTNRRRAA